MPTPHEVFGTLAARIAAGRWSEIAELYAEDAVAEIPFALPVPDRITGRATLHARFVALASGSLEMRAENIHVHGTDDPEVVIAEYDYRGRSLTTGLAFTVRNIQVLRVRDGLIVASRDFHDHVALAVATGQLPALAGAVGPDFTLDRAPAAG